MSQGFVCRRQVEVLVIMAATFGRTLVLPGHLDEPRAADAPGAGFADVWDWEALRSWNPVCSMQQYGRCAVFSKKGNAMSVWLTRRTFGRCRSAARRSTCMHLGSTHLH